MEAAHHPWPALGALLLRDGIVREEELEAALAAQRGSGRRLGEVLVESGIVTRTQVARVLAEQHELPFIELAESEVQVEAAIGFIHQQALTLVDDDVGKAADTALGVHEIEEAGDAGSPAVAPVNKPIRR